MTSRRRKYAAYLHSPEWKKLRSTILARDGLICWSCGEEANQVHHLNYKHFGEEREEDLVAACGGCNRAEREARF